MMSPVTVQMMSPMTVQAGWVLNMHPDVLVSRLLYDRAGPVTGPNPIG